MVRSTVIGKRILELRFGRLFLRRSDPKVHHLYPKIRNAKGFSLLELMIAMFILIILLSVAFPTYQRSVQHARQTVLKENLRYMRMAIDQFTSDKGKLPKSIDELVETKYLRERPIDPITEKDDWKEEQGEDPLIEGEQGLKDVRSNAEGVDFDGVAYEKY